VFTADAPNQLWLTDITEHKTAEFSDRRNTGGEEQGCRHGSTGSSGVSSWR
jgi:hypothetical protein